MLSPQFTYHFIFVTGWLVWLHPSAYFKLLSLTSSIPRCHSSTQRRWDESYPGECLCSSTLLEFKATITAFQRTKTPLIRCFRWCTSRSDRASSRAVFSYVDQFGLSLATVLGTVGLVFYTFPLLGIIFGPLIIFYAMVSVYYRRTSVSHVLLPTCWLLSRTT